MEQQLRLCQPLVQPVHLDGWGVCLLSEITELDVRLSDCQPIVTSDGLVTWYVTDGSAVRLYQLNPYRPAETAQTDHSWIGNVCTVCGDLKNSSVSSATVTLSAASYTYSGSARTPSVTVKINGTTLSSGADYTVSYSNNTKVGTATVKITGTGNYSGTVTKTYKITKASQTLKVTTSTKTVKYSKLKTAKQTVTAIKKVSGAKGKVTYKKVSGSSKLTINKSTGKVTVKKGTKKGTYKIKVKVASAATSSYKSASKTVTLTVKVK